MKSDRRNRTKKQRNLELLEQRVVLSGTPTLIPIRDDGSSFARDFVQVGDVAFFVANDGDNGRELWRTDGSAAGTSLVLDIHPGLASSDPTGLIEHNGMLYFAADDGTNGTELWKSDGTAAGTTMVHDIFPGEGYQEDQGTGPHSSLPDDIISANGRLFFSAIDQDNGRELWMSDGTSSGTTLVRDIAPGEDTDSVSTIPHSSSPTELVDSGGMIFFSADDGENGRELWQSNGTEAGTIMVRDIKTGEEPYTYGGNTYGTQPASSNPNNLTLVDGQVFFSAETNEAGRELWSTDGTEAGTNLVRDINSGTASGLEGSDFDSLIEVDGFLFFSATDSDGRELWTSDGTSNGTFQVSNIGPGTDNGLIGQDLATIDDLLYFVADDGSTGEELWETDGTVAGTRLVHDLEPGNDGSDPKELTVVDSRVFFVANTSEHGEELFESDGTSAGTFNAGDMIAGASGSFPEELGVLDNTLLFSAATGISGEGREVWSIDAEAERDDAATASIKIFVDGGEVAVPANIGLTSAGTQLSQIHTDAAGQLRIESIAGEAISANSIGDFFETWRTNAGAAGNNTNARFNDTQLLGNVASGRNTVQMFVNGQSVTSYEDYVVQDGDDIVLIYAENAVVSINTNFGSLLFELFEEDTPQTVANFLNYVNDGDYDNTFFHRSRAGFVIQGGGFRTSSQTFTDTSQFTAIEDDDPVQNEPGLENVRGTVAMAKLGGNPDSATNQFFVNLADNRLNLDNQNGGFTVFARVLDMSVVEAMEAVPSRDVDGGIYSELAVTNDDQLIVIESVGGTGFVGGTRFDDANANGVRDADESGLANEIVYIDENNNAVLDANELSTETDADGNFRLPTGAASATALVRFEQSGSKVLTTGAPSFDLDDSIGTVSFDIGEAEPDETTAGDDSFTVTNNGTERRFDVLANDTGGNDETPTISSVTQGSNGGTVSIVGNEIVYEAIDGFSGVETFTYTIQNADGVADTASVSVTVNEPADSGDPNSGEVSGYSFIDKDGDGSRSMGELGVPGSVIRLSGTSDAGEAVDQRVLTARDGSYRFVNVPAGSYTVTQQQPHALNDGSDSSSSSNATAGDDRISGITVTDGENVTDNNFGEASIRNEYVNISWFFASARSPQNSFVQAIAMAEELNGDAGLAKEIREGTGTTPITDDGDDNRSPIAAADTYTVDINDTLTVSASNGVLQNDSDPDGDQLTAAVNNEPTNGTLSLQSNGSFTYTPDSEFSGTDTFTYTATDNEGLSSTATVTVSVQGAPNTFRVSENATSGTLVGSLTADASLDGDIVFEFDDPAAEEELKLRPDDHIEGGADAAVVLIEYLDFQCPVCATYHPIVDDLVDEFGDELLVVRRHLPLPTIHPNAIAAGIAAEAAELQGEGNFERMGDLLFTNQDDWENLSDPSSVFEGYATDLNLNLETFREDVADPTLRARIDRDADNAATLGASATPTFYLDGQRIEDLPDDFAAFETLIENQIDDVDAVFSLDRVTGELSVRNGAALDFELRSTYSLEINATDEDGDTVPLTATIDLIDENESTPIANVDSFTVNENQTLNAMASNGVLDNDSDADGDNLTAVLVDDVTNGTLSLASDGSFTYTPDSGFVGNDEFTYQASDGEFSSSTVTVTITVNDVNLNPVASTDTYSTTENTPLTVNATAGVLSNDSDPDRDTLSAVITTQPSSGTIDLASDGSFTYTPNTAFIGTDTFAYRANDGELDSNIATVTVTVAGVNAPPVAVPDVYSIPQDTSLSTIESSGVLTNDSDADLDQFGAEIRTQPTNGSLTLNANGSFVYTPDPGFFGQDSFSYIAVDGTSESNEATVTITVTETIPTNAAPTAIGEIFGTPQDTVLNVDAATGVLRNDTDDDDGDSLTAELVDQATNGMVTLASDGSFTYTPDSGYIGSDTFTYRANDGTDKSELATVTINVTSVDSNATPVGIGDDYTVTKNTALSISATEGLLVNDSDADHDTLMAESGTVDPANGTVTIEADGSFTYTPDTDYVGDDSFTYRVTDGTATSADVVVNLTIEDTVSGNVAPVGNDDQYQTTEDVPLSALGQSGVLFNDRDADGDTLTATLLTTPTNGTVNLNDAGEFAYTPAADFNGTDSFTYQVSDGNGGTAESTVTITVESVNDGPLGVNDSYTVNADLVLAVSEAEGVLKNDSDIEKDPLSVELVEDVANGTLTLQSNGSFDYEADDGFSGIDSFSYRLFDGTEFFSPVTVIIQVFDENVAPMANADSYIVDVDTVLQIDADNGVLTNDRDQNSDVLTASISSQPANGTVVLQADGSFEYTPNSTFHGTDTFRYTVSDGEFESAPTLVAIFVNDAPVANDDSYVGLANNVLTVEPENSILANDADPDGDGLSIVVTSTPSDGTLLMNNLDGTFEFTPDAEFTGTVTFTYMINDSFEDSNEATVTIEIVSELPLTALPDTYAIREETALVRDAASGVLANDGVSNAATVELVTDVMNGTLSLAADGSFEYTSDVDFFGDDIFTYRVTDQTDNGTQTSDAITVTISVQNRRDTPIGVPDTYTLVDQIILTVDAENGVQANDINPDRVTLIASVVSDPANGNVVLSDDGSFSYMPQLGFNGTDSFTYTLTDNTIPDSPRVSDLTIVIIEVSSTSTVFPLPDAYETDEEQVLTVDATNGVLSNDTQLSGAPLSASIVADATNGSVVLNTDGSFEYTPDADFFGIDTFTYSASDDTSVSDPVVVNIMVNGINDAPTAVDDSYNVSLGQTLTVDAASGVLANDQDDGSLTAVLVDTTSDGQLVLQADGSFTYEPNAGFTGEDSFTYQANDGTGDSTATVTITVATTTTDYVAVDDLYQLREDGELNIPANFGVLVNDEQTDGITVAVASQPTIGTVTLNSDGSFIYMPAQDFVGDDTFTYIGSAGGGTATVTVRVSPRDDAPVAVDDNYNIGIDAVLDVNAANGVLGNDIEVDGDMLTASVISSTSNGQLSLQSDGSFTYTPDAGYEGSDSFTYRITDGVTESTATATIIVSDSITTVTTADDEYFIREDFVLSVDAADGVLGNDMVSNGATLTASVVTQPSNGTLVLNADGSFSYTPNADFNGDDSFGYVASAGTASSTEQIVTILVQAVNDAPVGTDDSFQVTENQPLVIAVSELIANDTDPDGDAIMVTNVSQPSNGLMLFDEGDNSYAYQPFSNFTGEDSFTYIPNDVFTADDEPDQNRAVTVTILVTSENGGAITTAADSYSVAEDTVLNEAATTGLLANDSGDQLSSVVATQPANGSLTLQSDGSFTYTPNENFFGTDSFTYTATNGSETSAATTVQIQVEPVNDRPSAQPESYFVGVDAPLSVNTVDGILANDVDVDGDSIAALLIDDVSNGTLTLNEDGSFDYTPNSGFSGEETFTYIATDQTRDSSVTTVTITVGVSATEYVAVDNLYELREDGQLNIPVNFGVLVMDLNSPVGNTVSVETEPSFGTLTLNPDGSFVYMPQLDFTGDDMFTYRASAGGDNATATVIIRVSNREDAPIANDDTYMVEMGQVLTANVLNSVLANDTDGDGDFLTAVPLTDPASGSLDFSADGTFTYTPEADFTGTDSFTYVARDDGALLSEAATVTINVTAPPAAAAARPADSDSGSPDTDLIDEAFADDDGLGDSLL